LDIADLLNREHVVAGLRTNDKPMLLSDLSQRAARVLAFDPQALLDPLQCREALGSTGVGAGVAIPHARISRLRRFFGLFARLDKPIDFESIDGQPVDLVFLLLAPELANTDQLAALACVARALRNPDTAAKLRAARNTTEICELLDLPLKGHA